jgi:hypothetical protein
MKTSKKFMELIQTILTVRFGKTFTVRSRFKIKRLNAIFLHFMILMGFFNCRIMQDTIKVTKNTNRL